MKAITLILLACTAMLITGCARQQAAAGPVASTPSPVAATPDPLGTWYLIDAPATAEGKRPMLEFRDGGQLGGNAGCNSLGASYTLSEGGRIAIGPVRQTKMYCDEPRMALEARVVGAMARTVRLEISGEKLVLRAEGGEALLELERAAPPAD